MRIRGKQKRKPMSEINVVPYIDVMLVLLVIFMVTAPLLTQGVSVELPEAPSETLQFEDQQETVIVSIDAQGRYYVDLGGDPETPVALKGIVERVSKVMKVKPKTPVLVRGDKTVAYGSVITLMTALQRAGVPNVGLVSEPPTEL